MKLNLSTAPDVIVSTLEREWAMASEAYKEHRGGAEAYDKWQDFLLEKAMDAERGFIADIFLWEPPEGNKWCVYENVTYDSASTYTHTAHQAFCYYETVPYAGVFQHITNFNKLTGAKRSGAIIYESHFFERLNERKIMKWEGLPTLIEFMSQNHSRMVYCTNPKTRQYDIRLDRCIGRGWAHRDYPSLYRIKSVLSDEQLTTRQRRDTALGRRIGDSTNKYIDLPFEEAYKRSQGKAAKALLDGNYEDFYNEQLKDFARINGLTLEQAQESVTYISFLQALIAAIRPSAFDTVSPDLLARIMEGASEVMAEWKEYHDEDGVNKKVIDTVVSIGKACNLNIKRQYVIKAMYNLKKGQQS